MRKLFIAVSVLFAMSSCTDNYVDDFIEDAKTAPTHRTNTLSLGSLTDTIPNDTTLCIVKKEKGILYSNDDYNTMFGFMENLYYSELFGVEKPVNPTYDEMMQVAASVIMTDTFADTLAEGECERVYRLVLAYFKIISPDAEIVSYLTYILNAGMY